MSTTNHQAVESLHDIEHTARRSAVAYGYQKASPHLIMWGVIWVAGYSTTFLRPQWSVVWPVLVLLGIAGDLGISWLTRTKESRTRGWRLAASIAVFFLFFVALFVIMPPRSGLQVGALFPLFVSLCYTIMGIWRSAPRMALLGLAVGALTVGGYLGMSQYFLLWMAVVGGGALILGGIWLRRV